MTRFLLFLTFWLLAATTHADPGAERVSTTAPAELKDLYFGEALYRAFQGEWFDAIARLDAELGQYHRLDQPGLDTLVHHLGRAEFAVGDFELAYRMHQRAGRAISTVVEGDVPESVRNEALYRLARIYFHKGRAAEALGAVERIAGEVPAALVDDVAFLRAQTLMSLGRNAEAADQLRELGDAPSLQGFTSYNLAIALLRSGRQTEGYGALDLAGQLRSALPATRAIRDKANLVLGDQLLGAQEYERAKGVLDRVRLEGPFSNRALLGSGWADAFRGDYERALVPWSLLVERKVTDEAVQEALLAVPYAYGKLQVHSRAALMYGRALEVFGGEVDKLDASIRSIREGKFLQALVREELKQDSNWVVRLRNLPETPETWYLLELMASHDFQESLKNYLDLEDLRKRLAVWEQDLDAFEEIIEKRRAYYEPLLPEIDRSFRRLDSQMRLRMEQRARIEKRLAGMLTAPRPDFLATVGERIARERLDRLEGALEAEGAAGEFADRIRRLRGLLLWEIRTDYDRRQTEAFEHLRELDGDIERLEAQYTAFVRTRQAATQSYRGYGDTLRRQRRRIAAARQQVATLMARQGQLLEAMAVEELTARRQRLEEFQIKARFALADSYDRATRAEGPKRTEP